jgi:chromosome segregation ATPase
VSDRYLAQAQRLGAQRDQLLAEVERLRADLQRLGADLASAQTELGCSRAEVQRLRAEHLEIVEELETRVEDLEQEVNTATASRSAANALLERHMQYTAEDRDDLLEETKAHLGAEPAAPGRGSQATAAEAVGFGHLADALRNPKEKA